MNVIAWSASISQLDGGLLAGSVELGNWATPVEAITAADDWLHANDIPIPNGTSWEPDGAHRYLLMRPDYLFVFTYRYGAGLWHAVVAEIETAEHLVQRAAPAPSDDAVHAPLLRLPARHDTPKTATAPADAPARADRTGPTT